METPRFISEDAMKTRRGSGEGFHDPAARMARTEQHQTNSTNKVTMDDQEMAWHNRFGEPQPYPTMVFSEEHQA